MSFAPASIHALAQQVVDAAIAQRLTISTAESCTGGMVSAALTDIPGSSAVFHRGYVTYANIAKSEMLGVSLALLGQHGAVSEAVARAMAEGALHAARADMAVAITGIAGPGGGSEQKPVGTVHFACAVRGRPTVHAHQSFSGDRSAVRLAAVEQALEMLRQALAASAALAR
ncbi:MAG: damage-inducible protein CinA [Azospirillum brasilense]|nr:MAG: damage-inducible protein CinA [Azospirillum brasilense]